MSDQTRRGFLREAFALQGAIGPQILPLTLLFGLISAAICFLASVIEQWADVRLVVEVSPHELAGAVLGLLLVFRTNLGYDRWYEARKLWGGFVDRTRSVTVAALAYGPNDPEWRNRFVRLTACYPSVVRCALRGLKPGNDVADLVGREKAAEITRAQHMPLFIASQLADMLQEANEKLGMDRFAFLQIDRERVLLLDNFGGCERILNTPIPLSYSIKIRQFIFLFLLTMPFALLHRLSSTWLVPVVTILVAYPLVALDQLGVELENPFSSDNLSHLPLEAIESTIQQNLLALLDAKNAKSG